MAVSDSAKVDLLYKKAFGVVKTDLPGNKAPSNEPEKSPSIIRADQIWWDSYYVANQFSTALSNGMITAKTGTNRVVATADVRTQKVSNVYPTWLTGVKNWVPPEMGDTYLVSVYAGPAGVTTDPATTGSCTQLFDVGIGGVGEWWFDYNAGILNFIGGTIPAALTSTSVIYITGYTYTGQLAGTTRPGALSYSANLYNTQDSYGRTGIEITGLPTFSNVKHTSVPNTYGGGIIPNPLGMFAKFASDGSLTATTAFDVSSGSGATGFLSVSNGGTGRTTLITNGVLVGNGTSAFNATNAPTSSTRVLVSSGGVPVFGQVDLSDSTGSVIGAVKIENGGTNASTAANARTSLGVPGLTTPNAFTVGGHTITNNSDQTALILKGNSVQTSNILSVQNNSANPILNVLPSSVDVFQPLTLVAGTTTLAPLKFNTATSLNTTSQPGAVEFDGKAFYGNTSNGRGYIPSEHYVISRATISWGVIAAGIITPIFINPGLTGLKITVQPNTTYFFECSFAMTGMSATTGNAQFVLDGDVTIADKQWHVVGADTLIPSNSAAGGANGGSYVTAGGIGASSMVTTSTNTALYATVTGFFVIGASTGANSIIPSFAPLNATGATFSVLTGAWFRCRAVGSDSVNARSQTIVGPWS